MEKLSYPIKVVQFGEGNFLRAFADYFIDCANERDDFNGQVVIVQPIENGLAAALNARDCTYTVHLRGGSCDYGRVISAVSRAVNPYEDADAFLALASIPSVRYVISNTTEAGIAFDPNVAYADRPPASFPAKLTVLLHRRWSEGLGGLIMLPCELIDDNGERLRDCVSRYVELWGLESAFAGWLETENRFCSTLVDRIVTGHPKNNNDDDDDPLSVAAEPFGLWVIEAEGAVKDELSFLENAAAPYGTVICVSDHKPYKRRKVRLLNGAHTALCAVGTLAGLSTVRECMENETTRRYIERVVYEEIIPILTDLNRQDVEQFAKDMFDRFNNPFIDHKLDSIALNMTSKWETRLEPTIKAYAEMFGKLPPLLTYSFAAIKAVGTAKDFDVLEKRLYAEIQGFREMVAMYEKQDLGGLCPPTPPT